MANRDPIAIVLPEEGSFLRHLLLHFILRQLDAMPRNRGDGYRVAVDAVHDLQGDCYLVSIEVGDPLHPTVMKGINRDPFLAVREVFGSAGARAHVPLLHTATTW